MRKKREVSFAEFLTQFEIVPSLKTRILNDTPIGQPFTCRSIEIFYKSNKNLVYSVVRELEDEGLLVREKADFAGRRNCTVFRRIQ